MHVKRKVLYSFITFVLLLLFFEVISWLSFKSIEKKFVIGKRSYQYYSNKKLHPYLGFYEADNPPLLFTQKRSSEIINMAIYGGSVAKQVCYEEKKNHLIIGGLKKRYPQETFNIECIAMGGGRQPQQLIAYLLYGEKYQVNIFLEGVNELSGLRRALSPEYPLSRVGLIAADNTLINKKALLLGLQKWAATTLVETSSNTLKVFKTLLIYVTYDLHRGIIRNQLNSGDYKYPPREKLLEIWREAIKKIDTISFYRKDKTYLIFQPVFEAKKEYQPQEKEIQRKEGPKRFLEDFNKIKSINNLKKVKYLDYSSFFLDSKEQDFIDDVHLTDKAINKLQQSIGEKLDL